MNMDCVIFDIDGTLADISERLHHIRKRPKNWDKFFAEVPQDKAIHAMVRLNNMLFDAGMRLILCSGRPEKLRKETETWLRKNDVKYHELHLRPDEDTRPDTVVKREMLRGIDTTRVLFVVEDRSRVVEMWRKEGLVCLQCAPGEF